MITPLREPEPPPRIVPTNTDAEQHFLSAILCNNRLLDYAENLRPEHFVSYAVHGRIFEAMRPLIDRGDSVDPVTLKPICDQDPALAEIGGARYLRRLADAGKLRAHRIEIEQLAHAVYDCWQRRELIMLHEEGAAAAYRYDLDDPALAQIERSEAELRRVAESGQTGAGFRRLSAATEEAVKIAEDAFKRGDRIAGVPTGFADFDKASEPPDWAAGGKVVKVDRVEWLYIPEATTVAQALGNGEVDYWENVPNDYAPALEHDANVVIRSNASGVGVMRFNHLNPPFNDVRMRQAVLAVADQRDYMSAIAGDPRNCRTCFSFYACDGPEPDEQGGKALSGSRDYEKAKRLIAEAGYKGERVVVLDAADIPQLHAESLVTADLLKRLGLNVELATAEWGTIIKRLNMREPVEQGGWSVFTTVYACFDVINPATNRNLRAGGVVGSPPGWPTDEKIESLRAAWFGAADNDRRRQLADRIQQRAFEIALYLPTGQFLARRAFRKNLAGVIDAPIPFLWNIEKRP